MTVRELTSGAVEALVGLALERALNVSCNVSKTPTSLWQGEALACSYANAKDTGTGDWWRATGSCIGARLRIPRSGSSRSRVRCWRWRVMTFGRKKATLFEFCDGE